MTITRLPRALALLILAPMLILGFAACSLMQKPSPFVGWFKSYANCRAEYAEVDARVAAAGVGDAAYFRVPGYPYLRTDRVLASFRNQVEGVDQVGGWIRRMREADQEAREFEYMNLGMNLQQAAIQRDRFLSCGRGLVGVELDDPADFARLVAAVPPPDEYSDLARTFGLYPLAVPLMKSGIAAQHEAVLREFSRPVQELQPPAPLWLWKVKPVEDMALVPGAVAKALPDELGFPGLVDSQWRALAEYYAPQFWIETAGDADRPAAALLTARGPSADPAQPLVNYQIGFTRFGGVALGQISYFVWFKGAEGSATGPLDGFIWRVTLDAQGAPLVYESLHASGRDHRWYPVQKLAARPDGDYWHEPPLIAEHAAPERFATLRLRTGSHEVRTVVAAGMVTAGEPREYELRRYEDLFTLPRPEGGTRSLFGPDGFIAGARGTDPDAWLASGIREPGELRQFGHHTIARIGRSHFDDPFLMEEVFIPPQPPVAGRPDGQPAS